MQSLHFDKFPITKHEFTASGLLRVTGAIARVGDLPYFQKDGSIRWEEVPPETLFDQEHLSSIVGIPVTLDHPPVPVTPDNYTKYSIGSVGDTVVTDQAEGKIEVLFTIGDKKAIESIQSGKTKELSMGYWASTEAIPGQPGRYRQTKRIANHVSVVAKARGGPELRLALDSYPDYSYLVDPVVSNPPIQEIKMATFTRDGVTFEFSEPQIAVLKSWFDKQDVQIDALRAELDTFKKDSATLALNGSKYLVPQEVAKLVSDSAPKVELEKLQVQIDALTAELAAAKNNQAQVAAQLDTRRRLERKASAYLKATNPGFNDDSLDSKSPREIQEMVISSKWSHFDSAYFASKSDESLEVLFDLATQDIPHTSSTAPFRQAIQSRVDSYEEGNELDKAKQEYAEYLNTSWEWVQKGRMN